MTPPSSLGTAGAEIYLDNNATTQPLSEVVEAVTRAMVDGYGNASSVHSAGERARRQLRRAREQVAAMLRAQVDQVIFTSGATEANNLLLQGFFAGAPRRSRLVTTRVEHSSVLTAAEHLRGRGIEVVVLPVDRNGLFDRQAMLDAIEPGSTLVSVQWANNETGIVQPVSELAAAARAAGAMFHSDAAQAVGKVAIDLENTPVDFVSLSGHKLHGPQGVGALVGSGVLEIRPLVFGGTQESALRPGTENIPAIVGLGTALEVRATRFNAVAKALRIMRDLFEARLAACGIVAAVNGVAVDRLPNTSNVRFVAVDGEALTIRLDRLGVRCSQSSACTNHKPEPSYVLRAMGLSEAEAYASVRFGFSELNTADEVESAVESIVQVHASLARFAVA